jgi:hypothetical protein
MLMMLWIAANVEGLIENYADMGILLGIQVMDSRILKNNPTERAYVTAGQCFYFVLRNDQGCRRGCSSESILEAKSNLQAGWQVE